MQKINKFTFHIALAHDMLKNGLIDGIIKEPIDEMLNVLSFTIAKGCSK